MTAKDFLAAVNFLRPQLMRGGGHAYKRIKMLDYFSKV